MRMLTLSLILAFALTGCGSGEGNVAKTFPVTGVLTVNGKPVPNVGVQLVPLEARAATKSDPGTLTASGITDKDGKFTLTASNGKPGAAKGKYKVILSGNSTLSQEEMAKALMGTGPKGKAPPKMEYPFPKQYASLSSSPKDFEVTDKAAELKLEL